MPHDVASPDAASRFQQEGFSVLGGFLTRAEVVELQELATLRLDSPYDPSCVRPNNTLVPLRWNDSVVRFVIASNLRLDRLNQAVSGRDLRWISAYLSVKDARSPALWWHQDWWCWDHPVSYQRSAAQIAVLCYLTDTSQENGALRVLPGSHLKSSPIHAVLSDTAGAHGIASNHAALNDLPGQATLSLHAGDAAVIDYRLLHGTHPNSTHRRRDCVIANFAPSWEHLPDDIRAHLIQHPALPLPGEILSSAGIVAALLPQYDGERRDLRLNRNAPGEFQIR